MRLIGLVVVVALIVLRPLGGEAQETGRVSRVGILVPDSVSRRAPALEAFGQQLRGLGYTDGQNIAIQIRSAEGKRERLLTLASELVGLKADVIVTTTTPAIQAAMQATSTIPIVTISADPIGTGLVAGLARPGGNITGVSNVGPQLTAKQLEFVKEAVATVKRVAFVWDPTNPASALRFKEAGIAGQTLGLQVESIEVRTPNDLENFLKSATGKRAGALIVSPPIAWAYGKHVVDFATENRLPTMFPYREFVEAGALMSYGVHSLDAWRRAATYVDKILKGAKPADLPIQQATRFELVVNLKTAKTLGLTIPQSILLRADQVIE
jgi:putative ABC transport system substrate-binding protein